MSESFSAVENPGRKTRLSISSSLTAASDAIRPFCCARRFIVSRDAPPVVADLNDDVGATLLGAEPDGPLGRLVVGQALGGGSMPWSTALRIMWVRGSLSSSSTVLSISVAPLISSRTSLPVAVARSRTRRGMRAKMSEPAGRGLP